jgi:lipoic acid synthetase
LASREEEVFQTMRDLRAVNVDIVTIGQYLQPSKKHLPVKEFVTPEQFAVYENGLELGFHVESGPLVRSSYKAQNIFYKNVYSVNRLINLKILKTSCHKWL